MSAPERDDVYPVRVAGNEPQGVGDSLDPNTDFDDARRRMVEEIEEEILHTFVYTGRQTLSDRVRDALLKTPRHEFVPPGLRHRAYENHALPMAGGQKMPPPFIVALMTEVLELEPNDVVLEVGTGSGYQTAILSNLVRTVRSIEIHEVLFNEVTERLKRLGFQNVQTRHADGNLGWPGNGAYNAIISTAAAARIPDSLLKQLAPGGANGDSGGRKGWRQKYHVRRKKRWTGVLQNAISYRSGTYRSPARNDNPFRGGHRIDLTLKLFFPKLSTRCRSRIMQSISAAHFTNRGFL